MSDTHDSRGCYFCGDIAVRGLPTEILQTLTQWLVAAGIPEVEIRPETLAWGHYRDVVGKLDCVAGQLRIISVLLSRANAQLNPHGLRAMLSSDGEEVIVQVQQHDDPQRSIILDRVSVPLGWGVWLTKTARDAQTNDGGTE